MDLFKEILSSLERESQRLYVTGPMSEQYRYELTSSLRETLTFYDCYRRTAVDEERIGG